MSIANIQLSMFTFFDKSSIRTIKVRSKRMIFSASTYTR
nr:MAG TPA: hypothetical protein [Caudoviricetes sp.]DAY70888.1 MAG TPA: hypothetical protein [Caudoviricetes sp.]